MADDIKIHKTKDKKSAYISLIPQLEALISGENDSIANIGNILAVLKYGFDFFWVGLYLIDENKEDELVLNLFQGPIACTRIKKGKGVCGTTWITEKLIIVPNVEDFVGHIACSSDTKSEIVLPLFDNSGKIFGVFDIDSDSLDSFDQVDAEYLTIIAKLIAKEYAK